MTIIVGAKLDDHILMASDSLAMNLDADAKERGIKLFRIHEMPIMWGFLGHATVGHAVRAEVDRRFETPQSRSRLRDWHAFGAFLGEQVAKANGDAKHRAELAGEELPRAYRIHALAGGYIRRQPGIAAIDSLGQVSIRDEPVFMCDEIPFHVGSAVLRALEHERGDAFVVNADVLRLTMKIMTDLVASAGPPIEIWEVAPSGARLLPD